MPSVGDQEIGDKLWRVHTKNSAHKIYVGESTTCLNQKGLRSFNVEQGCCGPQLLHAEELFLAEKEGQGPACHSREQQGLEMAAAWKEQKSENESHSVLSDSLRPHGLYSLLNSPDQNTGVGSLSLLQEIFPTQGLTQVSRIVGEGEGTPLQYSCLENPMDGGAC